MDENFELATELIETSAALAEVALRALAMLSARGEALDAQIVDLSAGVEAAKDLARRLMVIKPA